MNGTDEKKACVLAAAISIMLNEFVETGESKTLKAYSGTYTT